MLDSADDNCEHLGINGEFLCIRIFLEHLILVSKSTLLDGEPLRVLEDVLHDARAKEHIYGKESAFRRGFQQHLQGPRDEHKADKLLKHEQVGLSVIEGHHMMQEALPQKPEYYVRNGVYLLLGGIQGLLCDPKAAQFEQRSDVVFLFLADMD